MADEEMTLNERRKYLQKMQGRYPAADRAGRSALLTAMEAVTGLHRKRLTRLLHVPSLERRPRQRHRERTYGVAVRTVVALVWERLDSLCAERRTPARRPMARHLAAFGECRLSPAVEEQAGDGAADDRHAAAPDAAAAPQWPAAGQPGAAGGADGPAALGPERAGALRG